MLRAGQRYVLEETLAIHALWLKVEKPGSQPTGCPCGHEFRLGESFVAHQVDAIEKALELLD